MCEKPKFYITTASAYTSRKPHIGNSYEIVLTDAIARYKRMQGFDVFFLTGTDEHGQKIEEYAKEAGVSPKEYVDKVAGEIKGICDLLNTTYDHFVRTTDDYHEKAVQGIFKKLYEQGDIYTINIHSEMPSYPWNTVQQPLYYFGKNRPTYLCYLVLCGLHFKLLHLLENSFCLFSFDVDHF